MAVNKSAYWRQTPHEQYQPSKHYLTPGETLIAFWFVVLAIIVASSLFDALMAWWR